MPVETYSLKRKCKDCCNREGLLTVAPLVPNVVTEALHDKKAVFHPTGFVLPTSVQCRYAKVICHWKLVPPLPRLNWL